MTKVIARPSILAAILLAPLFVILAGCTPTSDATLPTTAPTTSIAPTPVTTPTPTPTPIALTMSPDGIGPLVVGEPVPATSEAAAVVKFDPKSCNTTNSTGAWVPANKKLTMVVVTANARKTQKITSLGVFHPGIMTAEGIGVTSSLAQLKLAYPDIVSAGPGPSTDMYVLHGSEGHLLFEVAWSGAKAKGYWTKAEQGTVLWMRAEANTIKIYSIANSDGYGVCHG